MPRSVNEVDSKIVYDLNDYRIPDISAGSIARFSRQIISLINVAGIQLSYLFKKEGKRYEQYSSVGKYRFIFAAVISQYTDNLALYHQRNPAIKSE
ncbi:hypothetical protein DYD21_04270 [Rhodohalobacter sp. SW132]|uniref:hypothetical protein n=1 Tax=Rhodohalobacter sp. SW132 TaxID=2293433 RepID=UPI000E22A540|nr:hypothetical protein [Rhodohalobacter sp. SW132]REL39177.1 hypothetical protein DYD21_04270 [Rhodohalobacter sp. SW132]